jgi:uncharacterized membrane protein YphA (DoxX/SURF4 family)
MKRSLVIEIISALFILLFVYTGINKLYSIHALKFVLKKYPLIGSISPIVAWGLPIIELVVAILLFLPRFRKIGLYGALALMTMFTFYLTYLLAFTSKMPCTCGGMLQKLSWPQHLFFNLFFIVLALIGIWINRGKHKQNSKAELSPAVFT